jgi:hypothetical protein
VGGRDRQGHDWQSVREGVAAKLCAGPDGQETFVWCRSVERREKEQAIDARFAQRIEAGLDQLGWRLERPRKALHRGKLERQIGRLLERNARAAGRYLIDLVEDPSRREFSLSGPCGRNGTIGPGTAKAATCCAPTSPTGMPSNCGGPTFSSARAEAAFRIHQSELSIRPIWHQREDRVQAHILVCFLAYVLWKTLEQWQSRAGLGHSPRTILDERGRIQSADVVLPLAEDSSRSLRIRCVVRPDKAQELLLHRLGLRLTGASPTPAIDQRNVVFGKKCPTFLPSTPGIKEAQNLCHARGGRPKVPARSR